MSVNNGATGLNLDPMGPVEFRIFGVFEGAENRSREEFNKGRFFNFGIVGETFQVPITDAELWNSPPSVGQKTWIEGQIFSTNFGGLRLSVKRLSYPTPEEVEKASFDGTFNGIFMIDKSTFPRQTGNTGYKFVYRACGLIFTKIFDDRETFDKFPGDEFLCMKGRVYSEQVYNSRFKQYRTKFFIEPTSFVTLRELIARRRAASESSPEGPDANRNSREGARRQAPQDAKKQPNE